MGTMANGTAIGPNRTVHVYTDAPLVKLELNGQEVVPATATPQYGNPSFSIKYEPGNLTAVAMDKNGQAAATTAKYTAGNAVSIRLSLDAPSRLTGTGSKLVADGEDTAMVRAELVDANGHLADQASNAVTFAVKSGEGRLWATHNGDPSNLEPNNGPTRKAYHGLAR